MITSSLPPERASVSGIRCAQFIPPPPFLPRMANLAGLAFQQQEHCYFRPALFYQTVQPWHVADAGLEFRLNFETQFNEARFPNTIDFQTHPERLEELKKKATCIVAEGRDDRPRLLRRLRNATTWNRPEEVLELIRTCYVTKDIALPALHEASASGFLSIVELFIQAGTSPEDVGPESTKNALHIACENGHEEVARYILTNMPSKEAVMSKTLDARGLNAFEILRENDMGMMARRLEALTVSTFGE